MARDFQTQTYVPSPQPQVSDEQQGLAAAVWREFELISKYIQDQGQIKLVPLAREPERPRAGQVVFADGANWDPGSGAGAYEYRSGSWNKL